MRSRRSDLRKRDQQSRLPHVLVALLVGVLLMLPTAASADDQAVPAVVPFAVNPQVGSGNSFSAPFQWYKVHLVSGDSLAATLTVTSDAGDDVYLRLYPPGTTHATQVGVQPISTAPLVWKATQTGDHLFAVFSFDYSSTSYTFVWNVTAGPTCTLSYAPGTGGSIEGSATQVVPFGSDGTTVTAVPASGYRFVSWSDGFPRATRGDIVADSDVSATAQFAKLITKASIARTPNTSRVTYTRRAGTARFTLAAVITGWGAQPVAGRYVYLQTSANGKTWKSTYKIKTSSAGRASRAFSVKTKQVRYYRWYVPAYNQVNLKTFGAATKVTVR